MSDVISEVMLSDVINDAMINYYLQHQAPQRPRSPPGRS